MAKDTKKTAEKAQETTVDNIVDQLDAKNTMQDGVKEAALAKMDKDLKEKQVNELIRAIERATYINNRFVITLRKNRQEEKAIKEALAKSKELLDSLSDSKLPTDKYDEELNALDKKLGEAFNEAKNEENKNVEKLRKNFVSYWDAEWEYERRIRRIRNNW